MVLKVSEMTWRLFIAYSFLEWKNINGDKGTYREEGALSELGLSLHKYPGMQVLEEGCLLIIYQFCLVIFSFILLTGLFVHLNYFLLSYEFRWLLYLDMFIIDHVLNFHLHQHPILPPTLSS